MSAGVRDGSQGTVSKGLLVVAVVLALVVGVVLAQFLPASLFGFGSDSGPGQSDPAHVHADLYTCPMHPDVLEDAPGSCPVCGMDLVLVERGEDSHASSTSAGADLHTCPMHPDVLNEGPGSCPVCGMDLVPVEVEPSQATVRIDPSMVQNMNIKTEAVTRRNLSRSIRTVGYLEYDQQSMVTVTPKYRGWVEKVYVNYVGEKVRKGQALFDIYSPDLVQTEQELLSALEFAKEMQGAPEDARKRAESMVESARTRLGYWDVPSEQIAELERTGEVFRSRTVRAPSGGLVMKRTPGLEGMAVSPGAELFHIADLSTLWVSVELFEDQLAWVREGTKASISLSYFPGESFEGTVRFLEPELSERTRTMRAKIEVANRGERLRKGMYATVGFNPIQVSEALAVPSQSVLRTGSRDVVVLSLGDGNFEPREVVLGQEADGYSEVLSGLEEGALVVTSSQFLIDSESSLREAIKKLVSSRTETRSNQQPVSHEH